jgi:hypothetical protein
MSHAPDLSAELSAVSFEEGSLLTGLDCLLLRETDRIKIRQRETIGAVDEMLLGRGEIPSSFAFLPAFANQMRR